MSSPLYDEAEKIVVSSKKDAFWLFIKLLSILEHCSCTCVYVCKQHQLLLPQPMLQHVALVMESSSHNTEVSS